MKKIVILGGSPAAVCAIEQIRSADQESEISLICFDNYLPANRELFHQVLAQTIKPEQAFYKPKDFYGHHRVNLLLNEKIARINLKRKVVVTENKTQLEFDILLIADTPGYRFADIKGNTKESIYGLRRLGDIDTIVKNFPFIDVVAIQSDTLSGLQAAIGFLKAKKEASLIASSASIWNRIFENDAIEWIKSVWESKGLNFVVNNSIAELLGEGSVKAVRLNSGKVLASDMAIFSEANCDLRLFSESPLQFDSKISVDAQFKTNLDYVFALDFVCNSYGQEDLMPLSLLEAQGAVAGHKIMGQDVALAPILLERHLAIDDFSLIVLGDIAGKEGQGERHFEAASGVYKKLYVEGQRLVGAVLVNLDHEKEKYKKIIEEKTDFKALEENLMAP